jgi:hypothetical protein
METGMKSPEKYVRIAITKNSKGLSIRDNRFAALGW